MLIAFGVLAWLSASAVAENGSAAYPPRQLLSIGQPIPPVELEKFVDGLVGKATEGNRVAGVAVSIVQNGKVVLKKGYAVASLSPARTVDPDTTLFHIGSITKLFTSILLMREVEAGRIGLDDPVNQHLPTSLQIPDEGFRKALRVRDLMTHQAGFEDASLGQLFVLDARKIRPLSLYLQQQRPHRVREPGILSSYSNYSLALAGAILEHVSGKSWQELIESKVLQPLGMTYATAREFYPARSDLPGPMSAELAGHLSSAFRHESAGLVSVPLEYATQIAPAGVMSAVFLRWPLRRASPLSESAPQARARTLRKLTAVLWLFCFVLLGVWVVRSVVDRTYAIYNWPSPFVIGGSTSALLASLCTLGLIAYLPATMKAGPPGLGWGLWRRIRFLCSVVVFGTCAAVMAMKGALQPWNS